MNDVHQLTALSMWNHRKKIHSQRSFVNVITEIYWKDYQVSKSPAAVFVPDFSEKFDERF